MTLLGPALAGSLPVGADRFVPLNVCSPGQTALKGAAGCMRLGGAVRADLSLGSGGRGRPSYGRALTSTTRTAGRLSVDVRIPTELGPVRAYASVKSIVSSGNDGR